MTKPAIAFCLLLVVPFSVGLADVETDTLHNNVYQDTASFACEGTACFVAFAPTQHVTTVVTAVNCYFQVSTGSQILFAQLSSQNSLARFAVPTFVSAYLSGTAYMGINAQTNLFISKGDTPIFLIDSSGSVPTEFNCTISGYHS